MSWQSPGMQEVMGTVSPIRLTAVHTGSKEGFLPEGQLVFKPSSVNGH
jgi:hypothetical protein